MTDPLRQLAEEMLYSQVSIVPAYGQKLRALLDAQETTVCRGCELGLPKMMLDDAGTRTDVSKRPGVPSHAVDDAWWPCDRWVRVAQQEPTGEPKCYSLVALAHYFGWGSMSAHEAWKFVIQREGLLRFIQEELETNKSYAKTAAEAIRERIAVLKRVASSESGQEEKP